MLNYRRICALASLCLVALACGSDVESTGRRSADLSVPGLTPVPCLSGSNDWDLSTTELLVADALTACSLDDAGSVIYTNLRDKHLTLVTDKMGQALGGGFSTEAVYSAWAVLRDKHPSGNCDPVTGQPTEPPGLEPSPVQERFVAPPNASPNLELWYENINSDLRTAGLNLCIAQRLRSSSPGASGGEALLLSEAEQRHLVETIRQRSQIAMVQYALLGVALSRPGLEHLVNLLPILPGKHIPGIGFWGASGSGFACPAESVCGQTDLDPDPSSTLTVVESMGRDFATAVQLNVEVTREMVSLAARSRSSRAATGGVGEARPDDLWGPASWYQRGMAILFGGDALAVRRNGPWIHPLGYELPNVFGGASAPRDWPSRERLGYSQTDISEPQVETLLALARQFNRVAIKPRAVGGGCNKYDIEASAQLLYDDIEVQLRLADCADYDKATDTCPVHPAQITIPQDTAEHVLWQKYRVTRDHAHTLSSFLADMIGDVQITNPTQKKGYSACSGQNIVGTLDFWLDQTKTPAINYVRLENDSLGNPTLFAPKSLAQLAPAYQGFSGLYLPTADVLDLGARGREQAFAGSQDSTVSDLKRTMGTASALTAVREMVFSSLAYIQENPGTIANVQDKYFARGNDILELIEGAIGPGSVTVRPFLQRNSENPPRLTIPQDGLGNPLYNVSVFFEKGGEFAEANAQVRAVRLDGPLDTQGLAGNLAEHPGSQIRGATILSAISSAFPNVARSYNGATSHNQQIAGAESAPWRIVFERVSVPDGRATFVWNRYVGTQPRWALLGGDVRLEDVPHHAQQFAAGGEFGDWAREQSMGLARNPIEPAYDGYGIASDWVPPLNAKLLGGADGASSVDFYLNAAELKAKEATKAVESSLDNLLVEQSSEAELSAATARAAAGLKEEAEALCGSGNTSCDTRVGFTQPNYPGVSPVPTCDPPPANTNINLILDCFVQGRVDAMNAQELAVAVPVFEKLNEPAAPTFLEYSGGTLQPLFIEQWAALREPHEHIAALTTAVAATKARIATAEAQLNAADQLCKDNCSVRAMAAALAAGTSTSVSVGASVGFPSSVSTTVTASFSPGPLIQQMQKCRDVCTSVAPAQSQHIEAVLDAWAGINSAARGLADAGARIAKSGAEILRATNQSRLASERHELEVELTKASQVTSFGLHRRYRSYDLWRAKALLENSRRYALAARRAIEARYVVKMSELTTPEAFVHSPAVWADEVYTYDLTLPAAVGLEVGSPTPGGIYTNKVSDYVANLQAFVDGYAVSRPAAVADEDIDVITLPGLQTTPVSFPVDVPGGGASMAPWELLCVAEPGELGELGFLAEQWTPVSSTIPVEQTCGKDCVACGCDTVQPPCSQVCLDECSFYKRPQRARLFFNLDPWGRRDHGYAVPPYEKRFNARWTQLAVNFVGTGLMDCTKAVDPLGCYSEAFIRYDLRHVGPPWVTNYEGVWQTLALPTGTIEGAKGLAAELWLDPLKDGWQTQYISAVSRFEFANRSFGGAYALEFEVRPETRLDRMERVQILAGSSYWVKQQ